MNKPLTDRQADIKTRLDNDEQVSDVAASLGVSRAAIYQACNAIRERHPDWRPKRPTAPRKAVSQRVSVHKVERAAQPKIAGRLDDLRTSLSDRRQIVRLQVAELEAEVAKLDAALVALA